MFFRAKLNSDLKVKKMCMSAGIVTAQQKGKRDRFLMVLKECGFDQILSVRYMAHPTTKKSLLIIIDRNLLWGEFIWHHHHCSLSQTVEKFFRPKSVMPFLLIQ